MERGNGKLAWIERWKENLNCVQEVAGTTKKREKRKKSETGSWGLKLKEMENGNGKKQSLNKLVNKWINGYTK